MKAADAAGNSDATPASFSWTITIPDTTPPDTTITASPSNPSNNPNPSFSFTSTEGSSTFECSLDGAAFVSCVSPQSYTGLADGSHTFQVKATDAAGNVDASPASTTWTIDTLAPDTTITSGPSDPSTSGTASFIFSATESGSTFQCTLDGAAFTSCTSPKNYTGLGNGNHTFQVKAADAAGNSDATPESFSWTVNLPVGGSIGDATAADFTAGTLDANIYVSQTADGEVILRPTAASEFEGTALPAGWFSTAWSAGGGSTVANGAVTVDGARSGTNGTYGNNRSLEFVATFTGAPWQEIGFGTDFSGTTRQMIFTTKEGNALYARFLNGSQNNQTLLSSSLIGSPHLYRIEWNASSIVYFVDGSQVASFARTISSQMRPLISDYDVGNGVLKVDWMRMSPYVSPGTFQSRIIDGGQSVNWGALTWTSSLPAGTSLIMSVRTGNTPTPDGTWSSYVTVPTSGDSVGTTARYLQYRAQLSTTANKSTSVLKDVTVQYTAP
ncbi:hypothetical protein A2706_00635 [Candidatus Peribacteria bacterium RIFCSPHIGHO2_01_FULL_51_35]|nr:MAG: hypothetical protein A2706_00635 [Candidatus Peribacteria bacterium RIFCSPHIGHO2_01_FULL_51_35]